MQISRKLMEAQEEDTLWGNLNENLQQEKALIVNASALVNKKVSVDGCGQVIVPEEYRRAVLYSAHFPALSGHSGQEEYTAL